MTRPLTFELATFDLLLGRECSVCKATGARFVKIRVTGRPEGPKADLDPETDPEVGEVRPMREQYYLVGECCVNKMVEVLRGS